MSLFVCFRENNNMKRINYIYIVFIALMILTTSCKTKENIESGNNTTQYQKSSYQTVSNLPQIKSEEKRLSQQEIDEITEFAKKMAETYCNIQKLKTTYEVDNDPNTKRRLLDQQKLYEEMKATSDKKYGGLLTKEEFEKDYNRFIKDCE